MSLEYAVSRLYEMGWEGGDGLLLQKLEDGRAYPAVADIRRYFEAEGENLVVRRVALFNCYRAEWASGYCVGTSEAEAAVYALAKLIEARREMVLGMGVGMVDAERGPSVGSRV